MKKLVSVFRVFFFLPSELLFSIIGPENRETEQVIYPIIARTALKQTRSEILTALVYFKWSDTPRAGRRAVRNSARPR
jgi:hypothetical protein